MTFTILTCVLGALIGLCMAGRLLNFMRLEGFRAVGPMPVVSHVFFGVAIYQGITRFIVAILRGIVEGLPKTDCVHLLPGEVVGFLAGVCLYAWRMRSRHPSDEDIAAYIDAQLPKDEAEALLEHFAKCEKCMDVMTETRHTNQALFPDKSQPERMP